MQFKQELQPRILVRRYKRFLADIEMPGKKALTVHCPNSSTGEFWLTTFLEMRK